MASNLANEHDDHHDHGDDGACCAHDHEHEHDSSVSSHSHQHGPSIGSTAAAAAEEEISDEQAFILELVDAFDDSANTLARVKELLTFFPHWVDLCDSDGRTALFLAVYMDNLALVTLLLEAGANPHASAESIIVLACLGGNLEIVCVLHQYGAKINDEYLGTSISPLYVACKMGHLKVVQWLVVNGAFIDEVDEDETTPFMVAAGKGYVQIVKFLTAMGATTERATPSGLSVAYYAAYSGHLALLKYFLENRVALRDADGNLTNLLDGAVRGDHFRIASYLLEHENIPDEHIDQSLMLAVRLKRVDMVELLILHDADIEDIDDQGMTSLYVAAQLGDVKIVETLITIGGDVSRLSSSTGYSPVHEMAKCGHHELLELVHQLHPETDFAMASQFDSLTPLHLAAGNDHEDAVRFLVGVINKETEGEANNDGEGDGDSVDVPGPRGQTPLILAAENGSFEAVKVLVAAGANVDARTGNGSTALIGAAYVGETTIIQFLCESGADIDLTTNRGVTALHAAAEYGHVTLVEYLLEERRARADFTWTGVSSILAGPVMNGHLEVIFMLVAHGAQFEHNDGQFLSPLHLAVQYKQLDTVRLLLLATGVDVNAMNDHPEDGIDMRSTPLMVAAQRGYLDIVKCLCEHGADVELRNLDGRSALDIALVTRTRNDNLVEYLSKEWNAYLDASLPVERVVERVF